MAEPSRVPTTKVAASAFAGSIATAVAAIIAWLLHDFAAVTVPPGIEGAFVVVISAIVGYMTPNLPHSPPPEDDRFE